MINSVQFYSILENGFAAYHRDYQSQDLSILAHDYLDYLMETIALDACVVTIVCDVKTNTGSKSSVMGHYLIQGGSVHYVFPAFARFVRELAE